MQQKEIVLLTAAPYLVNESDKVYLQNILEEDQLLSKALKEFDIACTRIAWDDPHFNWALATLVLIRTPWDYFNRYGEFIKWFQRAQRLTQFCNSKTLIEWNIDKHYLLDLKKAGIHIPNTLYIAPNSETTLLQSIEMTKSQRGFQGEEFVLKPCIAGGAWHTYKFNQSDWQKHEKVFQELIAKEAMMLQEFQKNIVKKGEVSMMVFDGKFTHAVLKMAKPGDFRVQDDYGGTVQAYQPSNEEIIFAEAVVQACTEMPIYARVDIFEDNEGKIALAELEIFEPELWFRLNPEAAKVMAKSIVDKYYT